MNITVERMIHFEKVLPDFKAAPLEAAGEERIVLFREANIRLADLHPEELNPTSRYLLEENLKFQRALRAHLLDKYQIDTLCLSSVLHLGTEKGVVGLIPPFVEVSEELVSIIPKPEDREPPNVQWVKILIIVDGIHRVWLARENNIPIRCLVANHIPREYPFTAYPCGWDEIKIYDVVPPNEKKRYYRRQEQYSFMRPLEILRATGINTREYNRK